MKKLTNQQMIDVQGGAPVTLEEYCATALVIIQNNDIGEELEALAGLTCSEVWSQ